MTYAYARVSTDKQEHDRQKQILKDYDIDETFFEVISGGKEAKKRPVFAEMCRKLEKGDKVYFTELSRLGRSTKDLVDTVDELVERYGVTLIFLKEGIKLGKDSEDAVSALIFHIMASIAEFERQLIRQRVNDGLAASKAKGKVGGRPRNEQLREDVISLLRKGFSQKEVATKLGITQPYVSNIRKEFLMIKEAEGDDIYDI